MRKINPGYRFFICDICFYSWKSKCRDHESPSGEYCVHCDEYCHPINSEEHPEWPVDKCGNLIDEEEI